MFFILSKVLLFLFSPFIWVILVCIFGFITKRSTYKKRAFIASFVMLLFFSNGFVFNQIIKWWEADPVTMHDLDSHYHYAIVLGGMASYDSVMHRINFHESIDRLLQTLDLYADNYIDTVVISGGSARLLYKERKEANVLKQYLVDVGLNENRIKAEPNSRNTYENASNTYKLLANPEKSNLLLITSAFHMRRAKAVFEKKGMDVDVYPTHFISDTGPFNPASLVLPNAATLSGWDILIKEIIGLIVYKIKGYA